MFAINKWLHTAEEALGFDGCKDGADGCPEAGGWLFEDVWLFVEGARVLGVVGVWGGGFCKSELGSCFTKGSPEDMVIG